MSGLGLIINDLYGQYGYRQAILPCTYGHCSLYFTGSGHMTNDLVVQLITWIYASSAWSDCKISITLLITTFFFGLPFFRIFFCRCSASDLVVSISPCREESVTVISHHHTAHAILCTILPISAVVWRVRFPVIVWFDVNGMYFV